MALAVAVSFTDKFWPSVIRLSDREQAQVNKAIVKLGEDPHADGLRLKPIQGDSSGKKWTCRASQEIRIFLFKHGPVLTLERAGHHDAMYELAERVSMIHNAGTGAIVVTERAIDEEGFLPRMPVSAGPSAPDEGPRPLDHWTDAELEEAGLGEAEIASLRTARTEDELLDLDIDEETLNLVLDLLGQTPEQWRAPSIDAEAEQGERIRRAILEHGALAGISPLFSAEQLEKLASAPIEDWMVFLHPDQQVAVTRRYEGPARIRGSAGTGKTVVALHRAAELVRRFREEEAIEGPRTVLFTTYIASLPPVFERLYHRLPQTQPDDDIEFWNIDKLARRICSDAGDRITIDPRVVDSSWAKAWKSSPLAAGGFSASYIQEEVRQVIKGRGIRDLDSYLAVERTGRGTRFAEPLRRQVWELRVEWDARLGEAGVLDFPDVVLRARDHARAAATPRFRAALIDEAQDLTLVGLQLIRALVNGPKAIDRSDGLLVVGDGAQRIYAGGFTLRQAGVEVRGRTTVLRTNYRNTRQIIEAAMAVAGADAVDDLGDQYARGEAEAEATRAGMKPALVGCEGTADECRWITDRIVDLRSSGALHLGDVGVFCATNKQAELVAEHLQLAGVPAMSLRDYDGTPIDKVKVGTHFRAKGLEFKVVFLPHLGANVFPRKPTAGQSEEEAAEHRTLALSQLFVAMTRARDGLFLLASGDPSPLLGSLDHFEVIDS